MGRLLASVAGVEFFCAIPPPCYPTPFSAFLTNSNSALSLLLIFIVASKFLTNWPRSGYFWQENRGERNIETGGKKVKLTILHRVSVLFGQLALYWQVG